MTFGSKVTKEDLIAAGLNPDEVTAALKAVKDGSATKEDLVKVTDALTAIQESFKVLEGKLGNNNNNNNNNDDDPNKNKKDPTKMTTEELAEQERLDYITDPVAFTNKKVANLGMGAAIEFKKMSRDLAYRELSRTLKGFVNPALKAEIDEEWKAYTPEFLARTNGDPSSLLTKVHDMILGKHHDEILQDTNKRDGKYNLVHSSSDTGGGGGGINSNINRGNDNKITPADHAQAIKFGMTDDEWLKQGEDMDKEEIERRKVPVTA